VPAPAGAVHSHPPAYGLDPVPQAGQARTAALVRAAGPVVADLHGQRVAGLLDENVHRRGVRVLGRVGEGLGGDIVGGDLAGAGEPAADPQLHPHRQRRAAGQRWPAIRLTASSRPVVNAARMSRFSSSSTRPQQAAAEDRHGQQ
jgi:hypothetical protein